MSLQPLLPAKLVKREGIKSEAEEILNVLKKEKAKRKKSYLPEKHNESERYYAYN